MATKTINISLDEKLLKEIDKAAKAEYSTRSDFFRTAAADRLKSSDDTDKLAHEYKLFVALYGQTLKNLANR